MPRSTRRFAICESAVCRWSRKSRDQLTFDGKIGGPATVAGWPKSWAEFSVHAQSEQTDVQLQAQADRTDRER